MTMYDVDFLLEKLAHQQLTLDEQVLIVIVLLPVQLGLKG